MSMLHQSERATVKTSYLHQNDLGIDEVGY